MRRAGALFQRRRQCRRWSPAGLCPCVGNSARPFRHPVESPCTVRQMGRWGRFGGFAGAAGVLLFLAGALLVGERPPFTADGTEVAAYVADHRTRIQVACALFAIAVPLLAWFLVTAMSLARVRRAGVLALACGLVFLTLFLADCTALAVSALRPNANPA